MPGLLDRSLTEEERALLATWQRSPNRVSYLRARVVLLAEQAGTATEIAGALGLHVQTVRDILRRFQMCGLKAIEPKPRPGRPLVFDDKAAAALMGLVREWPTVRGGEDDRWTLATAARALARELEVPSVSSGTVRRLLKRRRCSWQRAKEWLKSPDPRYAFKKTGVIVCSDG